MRYVSFCVIVMLMLTACHKDDGSAGSNSLVTDGIVQKAYNNFTLYFYYTALTQSGYADTLNERGPFTVFAPSNTAFQLAGFTSGVDIIHASDSIRTMMPYLILRQRIAIDSTPLAINQELTASSGQKMYLTHWGNPRDTAVVINGNRISTLSRPASNGLINISDGLIYPSVFNDVQAAVSGNQDLTFFNAMLIASGMDAELRQGGPYTVFAPLNSALSAIGITSTKTIFQMDPAHLKDFVKAHVVTGRRFIYDYILQADVTTNTYTETMEDGSEVAMILIPDITQTGRFKGVSLKTVGGTLVNVKTNNVLANNGVVHTIDKPLITNF
jgi:uncharacterized surface protein with fasciclin (FAS1) repeats